LSAVSASQKTGFSLQRTPIHPAFKSESVRQSPAFSERDTDVTRLIPQSEFHGQREQILDSYQSMEHFRQALNRPDDLPGFDDLLNAMSLHRDNYMQGANEQKLIDAVRNGDWAMGKLVCVLVLGAAGAVETGTKMTELGELLGQEIHEYSE